jgi:transposase
MSTQIRLRVTDEAWQEIVAVLDRVKHKAGSPPQQSDRMFIEAVLYVARTGILWRDLSKAFGNWDAVYNRFRRWEKRRVWRRLWEGLQGEECTRAKALFIDRTMVRAHQHAAGALKKTVVRWEAPARGSRASVTNARAQRSSGAGIGPTVTANGILGTASISRSPFQP